MPITDCPQECCGEMVWKKLCVIIKGGQLFNSDFFNNLKSVSTFIHRVKYMYVTDSILMTKLSWHNISITLKPLINCSKHFKMLYTYLMSDEDIINWHRLLGMLHLFWKQTIANRDSLGHRWHVARADCSKAETAEQ